MLKSYKFKINDINHFIISLSNNIDYFNSRIDPANDIKNKININLSKFQMEIIPILTNLIEYSKKHDEDTNIETNTDKNILLSSEISMGENPNNILTDENLREKNPTTKTKNSHKFCTDECYSCWVNNILSKFFYLLLQTAKFLGTGIYHDPNLIRLSEYYANIFYTWFKSNDIMFLNYIDNLTRLELYENYLNYKNKLNYSLIELNLGSETLDEILNYIDHDIVENLSIKLK